jgi:hypothetical protein
MRKAKFSNPSGEPGLFCCAEQGQEKCPKSRACSCLKNIGIPGFHGFGHGFVFPSRSGIS